MLKGKHILLGVTGSIAAYKAALLARMLVKEGAEVKVVMTKMAKEFISPLTLATLSKNPILVDFYNCENGDWNSHVSLGLWADLFLVAPCSANTMGKMVAGIADNLLLTTYLSLRCPVMIAPAMDMDMFLHPATSCNLAILKERGAIIVEPESGELASGLSGKGRMEEPEKIVGAIKQLFAAKSSSPLNGKRVLITAGPTRERIDPVRYISNYSTGKMGYALAEQAALRGADVTLVSGPVNVRTNIPGIKVKDVESADEMFASVAENLPQNDIIILCAAVADYKPASYKSSKIKREKETDPILELASNRDIAAWVGDNKDNGQISVGFALETDNEVENAMRKLERKNLNMIVLNSLNDSGAGFGTDTNRVSIIKRDGEVLEFDTKSKMSVAEDIVSEIEKYFIADNRQPC